MNLFFAGLLSAALAVQLPLAVSARPAGQTRPENKNDKAFRIHRIESGQNLSVLARKYGVSIKDLESANPGLKPMLAVGQEIRIPAAAKEAAGPPAKPATVAANVPAKAAAAKPAPAAAGLHEVRSGETLTSIAARYHVRIADLENWNHLQNGAIKAGQKLVVTGSGKGTVAAPVLTASAKPVAKPATLASAAPAAKPEPTRAVPAEPVPADARKPLLVTSAKPVTHTDEEAPLSVTAEPGVNRLGGKRESGLAAVINERIKSNKLLALHRFAPVGSTLQVRNSMNGRLVQVRVIGRLPDIGENEKVVVKLSKKASQDLGAVDSRFLVEVNTL